MKKEMEHAEDKIVALRAEMIAAGIDYYYIKDADPHGSEYVAPKYQIRSRISGFTGSNGTLLVTKKEAFLWTDGRYFIQAEQELRGTEIKLMRMQMKDVPSIEQLLAEHVVADETIAFNDECITQEEVERFSSKMKKNVQWNAMDNCRIAEKIAGVLDESMNASKAKILPIEYSGLSIGEKVKLLRQNLEEHDCDTILLNRLDEIMWLFNLRGGDIPCNPVLYSYALISDKEVKLYLNQGAITKELREYAKDNHFIIENYDEFYQDCEELPKTSTVLLTNRVSYRLYQIIQRNFSYKEGKSKIELLKAIKNPTEIRHLKDVYVRDSAVVCKFLYWLSKANLDNITEYDAAMKMDQLRKEAGATEPSFETISAYKENAALMHYEAKQNQCAALNREGLYLIDSGGQYVGGTTDVTRTIALGKCTEEMKQHFTSVVKGMLALQNVVFKKGTTGACLDILARQYLWKNGEDYRCGTGHGIGYMLSVHEGPQSIRPAGATDKTIFSTGMLISDEPGYYEEGYYGIRIENILLCVPAMETEYGDFLKFQPLTLVPIDQSMIKSDKLSAMEKEQLNQYHESVFHTIKSYLAEDEQEWLKEACRMI